MARLENQISNSSEEEEEELSTEGSESESEPGKTSTPPPSSKKSQLTPNSSSGDESETESESDPEKAPGKKNLVANPNPNPNLNVKPLASKPMEEDDEGAMDDVELKKPRSKNPTSRYSPPLIKPSAGKRPATVVVDGGSDLDSKRMMKKKTVVAMAAPDAVVVVESNSNGIGGEKKQLFQRLWSENDEVELIKGMISYVEEKGKDPFSDVNEFHEFVKKSLQVDVNTRQMTTKVRRLKKKFENNAAKVENKGKVRSFSNPHEKEMYHLSKSLWGIGGSSNGVMSSRVKKIRVTSKSNKISKNSKGVGSGNGDVVLDVTPISVKPKLVHGQGQVQVQVQGQPSSSNGLVNLDLLMGLGPVTDEMIMIKGLELASEAKRVELLQKWKDLKMMELKHFVEKVDLLKEQAEVVMDHLEKSGGAN